MHNITRLKEYFQKNPLMGFVAVIVFITIFLGIGAFIGTRPKDTANKDSVSPIPTEEVTEDSNTDQDSGSANEDTAASEHKAEPTATETEGNVTSTPTKSVTSTPGSTNTPANTKININLLGDVYEDLNCNGARDSGENAVTKTVTVNIYKMPEFSAYTSVTTDGVGHYSYNNSIDKGSSLQLKIGPVSPEGYKSNPKVEYPTSTLSQDSPSARVDIPQVPSDKVSACQ
jgi:cytoskeletal protein RodZ